VFQDTEEKKKSPV